MHIATIIKTQEELIPNLNLLYKELSNKADEFSHIYKVGRTHLQDATPMKLGQEFSAFAHMIKKDIERIESVIPDIL